LIRMICSVHFFFKLSGCLYFFRSPGLQLHGWSFLLLWKVSSLCLTGNGLLPLISFRISFHFLHSVLHFFNIPLKIILNFKPCIFWL
jgi:hypothetical protein